MQQPQGRTALSGMLSIFGRLVAPADVVERQLTTLLGVLWSTGGASVLLAWLLGLYDGGWPRGTAATGAAAVGIGTALLLVRRRRLGTTLDVSLTLLGSLAIALVTLWAGPRGVGVTGILYAYVTCFAAISLTRHAVTIAVASSAMHLAALLAAGHDGAAATWMLTWGTAALTGLITGAAVEWLRRTITQLEAADEHRTRFVATVSHELRTPLTAIIGANFTLQHHWADLPEHDRRRFLDVIDRQAGRQLRMVKDLLTMATLMRGSLVADVQEADVGGVLAEVVSTMPFDVEVDVTEEVTVSMDPDHLERVLDNLLVNADRYGRPPLVVRVAQCGDHARIDVTDHGTGVPEGRFEDDLLDPFVQGDSGDRRSSVGLGLGLTLCRELLKLNNGRLDYQDTAGGGATFRLTVPVPPGTAAARHQPL